jgi:hypothetical protein
VKELSAIGVVVLILAGCTSSIGGTPTSAGPQSSHPTASSSEPRQPDCQQISPGDPDYGAHVDSSGGAAGDTLVVEGTTLRDEGGGFSQASRLEVWWNTRIPSMQGTKPINPDSPIIRLAQVRGMDRCHFQTRFKVPSVPSGGYLVRVFIYWKGGYGLFGWRHFTVKPAGAEATRAVSVDGVTLTVPDGWHVEEAPASAIEWPKMILTVSSSRLTGESECASIRDLPADEFLVTMHEWPNSSGFLDEYKQSLEQLSVSDQNLVEMDCLPHALHVYLIMLKVGDRAFWLWLAFGSQTNSTSRDAVLTSLSSMTTAT